jgi:ABC-2 type transport system ATP-binding protein
VSLRFSDAAELDLAARALGAIGRDDEDLTLQVPSDGGVRSLRALLDQLNRAGIEPAELTVHTPDLDDVFLALTDHSARSPAAAHAALLSPPPRFAPAPASITENGADR